MHQGRYFDLFSAGIPASRTDWHRDDPRSKHLLNGRMKDTKEGKAVRKEVREEMRENERRELKRETGVYLGNCFGWWQTDMGGWVSHLVSQRERAVRWPGSVQAKETFKWWNLDVGAHSFSLPWTLCISSPLFHLFFFLIIGHKIKSIYAINPSWILWTKFLNF